ncbi:MAG: DMT family transporter [Sphingomonadaceae bacterium]
MLRSVALIGLALLAFAGNSLLNRVALASGAIDPGSFTVIRLVSGAIMLALVMRIQREPDFWPRLSDARGGVSLFIYAGCFSFAYTDLQAGTGALLLFTSVQLAMQVIAFIRGNRPSGFQIAGLVLALAGLYWLLGPGASPPPLGAAVLMVTSGSAWGVYSSLGLTGSAPALATARNFLFAAPLSLILLLFLPTTLSHYGIGLAVGAGAITSALGYVIWYKALPGLSATSAGVAQLLVPPIASMGGMVFLDEVISSRLIAATGLILIGIALTFWKGKCAK